MIAELNVELLILKFNYIGEKACLLSTRSEQRSREWLACDPVREAERDGDPAMSSASQS